MLRLHRRKIQDRILPCLEGPESISITGSKQVGKTSLLKLLDREIKKRWGQTRDSVFFDLDEPTHLAALNRDPAHFPEYCRLSGADPGKQLVVLIDEIQNLQNPFQFIQHVCRQAPPVKLIVAGSTTFNIQKFCDPSPAEHIHFHLYPLSFEEFLSFRQVHHLCQLKKCGGLMALIQGDPSFDPRMLRSAQPELQLYFEEFVLFGGYPAVVLAASEKEKKAQLKKVLQTIEIQCVNVCFDVANMGAFRSLLRTMAASSGDLLNVNGLSRGLKIGRDTVRRYLAILEGAFVNTALPPYHNGHKKELTKMQKTYFVDTGLRNYAINNFSDLRYRPDKERLFENAVWCELAKNLPDGGDLFYWRTIARNEVSFVMTGEHFPSVAVQATSDGHLAKPGGFRAFQKIYPGFRQFVINLEQFSTHDEVTEIPGWMI